MFLTRFLYREVASHPIYRTNQKRFCEYWRLELEVAAGFTVALINVAKVVQNAHDLCTCRFCPFQESVMAFHIVPFAPDFARHVLLSEHHLDGQNHEHGIGVKLHVTTSVGIKLFEKPTAIVCFLLCYLIFFLGPKTLGNYKIPLIK